MLLDACVNLMHICFRIHYIVDIFMELLYSDIMSCL